MTYTRTRSMPCLLIGLMMASLTCLAIGIRHHEAHQDPCHRLHSCPSDHGSYVCGDKGRFDQCQDNQYGLAGKPRAVSSPHPSPTPSPPMPCGPMAPAAWSVCFTPGAPCTDQIVNALADAKTSILVQAYSFTAAPIAKAPVDAHTRGVRIDVILDKSHRTDKDSGADFLANQGVPTTIDAAHAIAHNTIMIIDGETIITGSCHFTKAAQEKNAENMLIIRDQALATWYIQNWQAHAEHSQPYVGRRVRQ